MIFFHATLLDGSRNRYASLFFVACIDQDDNELITLEKIHLFVEVLDRYFGNVCELDIIFNFHKAYYILDELFIGGELQVPLLAPLTAVLARCFYPYPHWHTAYLILEQDPYIFVLEMELNMTSKCLLVRVRHAHTGRRVRRRRCCEFAHRWTS